MLRSCQQVVVRVRGGQRSLGLASREMHGRSRISAAAGQAGAQEQAPKPDIRKLAQMAQLAITDQEAADMEGKITNILGWFDQLQTVDTRGVVPAIHASQQGTVLRDDTPAACNLRAELLSLAPAQEKDYVRVPRTATGADADTNGAGKPAVAAVAGSAPPPSASPAGGATAASDVARDALRVMDFRVGRIVSCEKHPEADSLYVEKIDVGEAQPRVIVSGLVKHVPIEDMQDRMVVVIANLKPRNMRGIKSAGMVLAASDAEKTRVVPVLPPAGAVVGERLWFGGDKEQAAPAVPNAVEKKKLWDAVAPGLRTDSRGVATWNGLAMNTSAGPVTVPDLPDCRVA